MGSKIRILTDCWTVTKPGRGHADYEVNVATAWVDLPASTDRAAQLHSGQKVDLGTFKKLLGEDAAKVLRMGKSHIADRTAAELHTSFEEAAKVVVQTLEARLQPLEQAYDDIEAQVRAEVEKRYEGLLGEYEDVSAKLQKAKNALAALAVLEG